METSQEKAAILAALRAWITQRPGLEPGNYGSWRDYRNESARIGRDLADARQLLRAVELSGMDAATLRSGFRAFSGRLTLTDRPDGSVALDYCTGQYWPTEYRAAACAVLSAALWDYYREDFAKAARPGESPGGAIRRRFRELYGRRMASRWFD